MSGGEGSGVADAAGMEERRRSVCVRVRWRCAAVAVAEAVVAVVTGVWAVREGERV